MKFPKDNIIDKWLDQKGDPEVAKLVQRNLALADRVLTILDERSINKSTFAEMLGKRPSEITKWLSGTHNLNMKSIVKMEHALGVPLINIIGEQNNAKEYKYVYLGKIEGSMDAAISDYEQTIINNDEPEDNGHDIAL